jgi:Xaa-Pro aminopeptidase
VPDLLIFADTVRSAELRHEIPALVPDAILYAETNGSRHVVAPSAELPIIGGVGEYTLHPFEEFGVDELRRTSLSNGELLDQIIVRAVTAFGIERAVVPASFPVLTADRLREAGIELVPERDLFIERRRAKSGAELAGIRRAQAAAEAGMAAARELLRRAEPDRDGVLQVDGHALTSERIKATISTEFITHGTTADAFVVSHGPQAAIGHHLGEGKLRAGETVVIDLWPRDDKSACYADMTRTFVVGDVPDEVANWHRLCLEVLERVRAAARPGVSGKELFGTACEIFERQGHLTQRTKVFGETLEEGFFHALGHGVGLEVHESPFLNLTGSEPLVAGDVIAVEPGLYRPGLGGVRLEDLLLVRGDGCETLTDFPYEL